MNPEKAIKILNKILRKKKPKTFSSSWIFKNALPVYTFIRKSVRTENDDIDWDLVTSLLDKKFQERWVRFRIRKVKSYENQKEVDKILNKNREKLYTFFTLYFKDDREIRNRIIVALVRIAQKGNSLAYQKLTELLEFTIDSWIEKYYSLKKWKNYKSDLGVQIERCIRRYRYTGSFMGYLFMTLVYSGRGLRPIYNSSLDKPMFDGETSLIDFITEDQETRIYSVFEKN